MRLAVAAIVGPRPRPKLRVLHRAPTASSASSTVPQLRAPRPPPHPLPRDPPPLSTIFIAHGTVSRPSRRYVVCSSVDLTPPLPSTSPPPLLLSCRLALSVPQDHPLRVVGSTQERRGRGAGRGALAGGARCGSPVTPPTSTTGDEPVVLGSDVAGRHLGLQEDAPLPRLAHRSSLINQ